MMLTVDRFGCLDDDDDDMLLFSFEEAMTE
jgi:hypothetical protein